MAERVMGAAQRRRERPAPRVSPARVLSVKNGAGNGPPPQRAAGGGWRSTRRTLAHGRSSLPPQRWTVDEASGGEARGQGGGRARDALWPTGTDAPASWDAANQPGGAAGKHRSGSRGTPWSSLANSLPRCRSSMLLCRSPETSCWKPSRNDVVEPVFEVPKIILVDYTPLRAVPREPQMAEQLVEVPVPVWTELTCDRDVAGRVWCRIAAYGVRQGIFLVAIGYSALSVAHPAGDPPAHGGVLILGKYEDFPLPCIWQSLVRVSSCLRCSGLWTFLGILFRNGFRLRHSLVRQWIHACVSLRGFLEVFHTFST